MKSLNHFRVLSAVMVFLALARPNLISAADAPAKKDAQAVLKEMRLKKFTKELELNSEQQKKVETIFDGENQQTAKLNEDATLSIRDKRAKVQKLQQETYDKIRPMLTAAQLEKFEKLMVKPAPKKR